MLSSPIRSAHLPGTPLLCRQRRPWAEPPLLAFRTRAGRDRTTERSAAQRREWPGFAEYRVMLKQARSGRTAPEGPCRCVAGSWLTAKRGGKGCSAEDRPGAFLPPITCSIFVIPGADGDSCSLMCLMTQFMCKGARLDILERGCNASLSGRTSPRIRITSSSSMYHVYLPELKRNFEGSPPTSANSRVRRLMSASSSRTFAGRRRPPDIHTASTLFAQQILQSLMVFYSSNKVLISEGA